MGPITFAEQVFLEQWKRQDFSGYNEAEVREEFIIHLLHALGWRKGTTYDLEMEKSLKLSTAFHRVGRKTVNIDYAPSVRKRYFWIIEAKPGKERGMEMGDLLQAHLYAVHPEIQARLIVLTNGWEVRIYDALTVSSWEDPLLVMAQGDPAEKFLELREILGAENMLVYQRTRLLDIVKSTFETEIDLIAIEKIAWSLKKLANDGQALVRANAEKAWMGGMGEFYEAQRTALERDSIDVVMVKMDFPTNAMPPPTNEFVRRVQLADAPERARLVDLLAMNYRARPHNVFRTAALRVLVDLVEAKIEVPKSNYVTSVHGCISELGFANSIYWSGVSNALCHLDNVALRAAMKLCLRNVRVFEKIFDEWKRAMSGQELAKLRPSLEPVIVGSAGHLQEIFWRWYCLKDEAEVWDGIWNLQALEAEIERLPDPGYTGEVLDFFGLAYVGRPPRDQLIAGTYNVLTRKREVLRQPELDPRLIAFMNLTREQALATIPAERLAPAGWKPSKTLADISSTLDVIVRTRLEAIVGTQIQKARQ